MPGGRHQTFGRLTPVRGSLTNTRLFSNNKGIDHFEESPIIPAVFGSADTCGIDLSALEE